MAIPRIVLSLITRTHLASYWLLGSWLGGGRSALLLTTVGQKTGKPRTVPLTFIKDGKNYVVVGSNGGAPRPPQWWINLKVNPNAVIRVGKERHPVIAEKTSEEDHNRLWPKLLKVYAGYDNYARTAGREIPVILLRPSSPSSDQT